MPVHAAHVCLLSDCIISLHVTLDSCLIGQLSSSSFLLSSFGSYSGLCQSPKENFWKFLWQYFYRWDTLLVAQPTDWDSEG